MHDENSVCDSKYDGCGRFSAGTEKQDDSGLEWSAGLGIFKKHVLVITAKFLLEYRIVGH